MAALARLDSEVVAPHKAKVSALPQKGELGELAFNHVWRSIFTVVVNNNDLKAGLTFGFTQRLKARPKVAQGVPAADGDGQVEIRHECRVPAQGQSHRIEQRQEAEGACPSHESAFLGSEQGCNGSPIPFGA